VALRLRAASPNLALHSKDWRPSMGAEEPRAPTRGPLAYMGLTITNANNKRGAARGRALATIHRDPRLYHGCTTARMVSPLVLS
jgi:hypothetical protein